MVVVPGSLAQEGIWGSSGGPIWGPIWVLGRMHWIWGPGSRLPLYANQTLHQIWGSGSVGHHPIGGRSGHLLGGNQGYPGPEDAGPLLGGGCYPLGIGPGRDGLPLPVRGW